MNNDNVGRVAFVGILGVIGAVAIKLKGSVTNKNCLYICN